jgi:hypothetical protein
MTDKKETEKLARLWMSDWNEKHIEKIMSHYADDVVFYSNTVITRWNEPSGRLSGKEAVEKHFCKGMEEVPDMRFDFHSILYGCESIILVYKTQAGLLAADYILFNEKGLVKEVRSHKAG